MDKNLLPCVEINPQGEHKSSIIWLHGLGASGHDFEPVVPELHVPPELGLRFVFPHAPERAVTINGGMVMPAWYDILNIDLQKASRKVTTQDVLDSSAQTSALIQRELDLGIPSEKIILAGFSQGGAIALHTSVRYPKKLAGILALSTYLPTGGLAEEHHTANLETPVWMASGRLDLVVPKGASISAGEELKQAGFQVNWNEYPNMGHSLCLEEIVDIGMWVREVLS